MTLLIVNYHYIREETYQSGIYPITLKNLYKQVEKLSVNHQFISQNELVKWIENNNYPDKKCCLLTFDDGLKEQMTAFDLLQSKGIPAIFYVPTNAIQYRQILDVHKLHYIRSMVNDNVLFNLLDQKHKISTIDFDLKSLNDQYRYDNEKSQKIKYFINFTLDKDDKNKLINDLFSSIVTDHQRLADQLYMNESDIRVLSESGALGSHGSVHIPLAEVDFKKAKNYIKESINYLENVTSTPVYSFSYPYGGKNAVNESLRYAFTETNVAFALTMWRGINNNDDFENPYFLNRIDTNDAPGGKLCANIN